MKQVLCILITVSHCHTDMTIPHLSFGNSFQEENQKKGRESLNIYMDKYDSRRAPSQHLSEGWPIGWLVPVRTLLPLPLVLSHLEEESVVASMAKRGHETRGKSKS